MMENQPMPTYVYDGSFAGLLCCVYESYTQKQVPADILAATQPLPALLPLKHISTTSEHARRVYDSLAKSMGREAQSLIRVAFWHACEDKGMAIYRFISLGYRMGKRTMYALGMEAVQRIYAMEQAVRHESHQFEGFVRFREYQGNLVARIHPKHFVLPLLKGHFCERYPEERFLIHDASHRIALVYQPYAAQLIHLQALQTPGTAREDAFEDFWKAYYDAICIEERKNLRCRRSNMPKRYWQQLPEMQPARNRLERPRAIALQPMEQIEERG